MQKLNNTHFATERAKNGKTGEIEFIKAAFPQKHEESL